MTTAKAQAVQLLISRESTPGTPPTTLWRTTQPNPDGIQDFAADYVDVRRDVLNPNFTDEKGDHVGENGSFTLVHDLTKDLLDFIGPGILRSLGKVAGDENTTEIYYPTAAVDGGGSNDSFTVAADGDIIDGTIFRTRGFVNAANNGVFVAAGTSGTTALKTATGLLVAETVSPTGSAQAQVCGYQFAAGDGQIDANGDFIATLKDLTTLNLTDGQELWFGGVAAATRFAGDATYNGRAFVNGTITAGKIPLKWRSWTVGAADAAAAKTIQIFWGVHYRNVAQGHADFIDEPVWCFEKKDTGVGAAGADVYNYADRMGINTLSLAVGLEGKIEATINFVGARITAPVLVASRRAGPSTATPPVAIELFDTRAGSRGGDTALLRIVTASDFSALVAKVNSATIRFNHGASVQKQVGLDDGPVNFGKIRPSATMETFYELDDVPNAIADNTTVRLEGVFINDSGAVSITLPNGTLSGGKPKYGADAPVMMGVEFTSHRDPVSNCVAIVSVFPYLPRKTITAT